MSPTPLRFDHSGLQILDDGESLELLSSVPIGRLVFTMGGLPAVRLVNFVLDGDSLIFATADGDKYRAAERGDVVAFEVDAVDEDRHLGWTVTAAGHLSVIDPDEAESLRHGLALRPWAPQHEVHQPYRGQPALGEDETTDRHGGEQLQRLAVVEDLQPTVVETARCGTHRCPFRTKLRSSLGSSTGCDPGSDTR